jgi:hypothetical protein
LEANLNLNLHEYGQCLFGLGGEYLEAGEALHRGANTKWLPMYFLICHSLELSLKAFLAERGYSEKKLRSIGHSIAKCLREAEEKGLTVSLTQPDRLDVMGLDPHYSAKALEYFYHEAKTFPNIENLINITKILRTQIFDCITEIEFENMK